jgi:cytochrome c oxidase subunit 3
MMTGLHMLHVFAGITILIVLLILNLKGKFSAEYNTPIEVGGLYWHLVDLIWIYLFPLLYLIS